jgi:hypothetical protein
MRGYKGGAREVLREVEKTLRRQAEQLKHI